MNVRNCLTMMRSHEFRLFRLLTVVIFLALSAFSALAQQTTPGKPKSENESVVSDAEKRRASFEMVWQTVDKNFYDPKFNGVDWKAVHDRYAPLVARAGLRSGFVIKSVNGKPLSEAITQIEQNPVFHEIIRPEVPLVLVAQFINGNLRDPVSLTYVNGRNLQRNITIKREKLNGEMSAAIGNLPPLFTEFEAKRLSGGIAY